MEVNVRLGEVVNDNFNALKRDAIHIPVILCTTGEELNPGQPVCIVDGNIAVSSRYYKDGTKEPYVGIVDPYLKTSVWDGNWFWVCLYPGSVSSLSHVWRHDDIDRPNTDSREIAKLVVPCEEVPDFVTDLAALMEVDSEDLYELSVKALLDGTLQVVFPYDCHYSMPEDKFIDYWNRLADHRGVVRPKIRRDIYGEPRGYFSCSC